MLLCVSYNWFHERTKHQTMQIREMGMLDTAKLTAHTGKRDGACRLRNGDMPGMRRHPSVRAFRVAQQFVCRLCSEVARHHRALHTNRMRVHFTSPCA